MENSKSLTALFIIFALLCFCGCSQPGGENASAGDKIVAEIDDFDLTVNDFNAGARLVRPEAADAQTKKRILEELINKKILILEAQKLNFDKDRYFMKEIERYWEQALLKLLVKRKSEEISRRISVNESELRQEYSRMSRRILAQIILLSDSKCPQGEADETLFSGKQSEWYSQGDLPEALEERFFSLKPGEKSGYFTYNGNCVVIKVIKEEKTDIEPFEKISDRLHSEILNKKLAKGLEEWVGALRQKAKIKINEDVLNNLEMNASQ
ncbi:MAG: peptidylprolyl isomerase [Candidatus Omnitrophota bacterium]